MTVIAMLIHLSIHQFALVEHLDLELKQGMSVITGETGAGKSILLDALGLALGNRADSGFIRNGAEQAEISATFSLNQQASLWLEHNDIPVEDSIILRRVITAEGRSRGYINGRMVPSSDLRTLGQLLIEIHSQHAHQKLLQKDSAREIVDAYAGLQLQANEVSLLHSEWQQLHKQINKLREDSRETQAQRQLLSYQVQELQELAPNSVELAELEEEQKRLANAESTLLNSQTALAACNGEEETNAIQLAQLALNRLSDIDDQHPLINETRDLLQQACIQLEEAGSSLQRYLDQVDINPHRLQQIEQRLGELYSMARKHHIQPENLYDYWQELEQQLSQLSLSDEDLDALAQQLHHKEQEYQKSALQLSQARQQAAKKMDKAIESHFDALALGKAKFTTAFETSEPSRHGLDNISFLVQTNPGTPQGLLSKVASGGELARISLAIQVVTAASSSIPSLIFDEVDVGIGGGTAERVGRLLRQLGENSQVLCVTHQPQVASLAHQHYQISKISGASTTKTQLRLLNKGQRAEEIARMLGGVEITAQTLAHAQEMLANTASGH